MFKTLEELQEKYPIGSTYYIYWTPIKAWCPNINDILVFKNEHPEARNFMICDNDWITAEEKHEEKVTGYIFDGEYWYPAYRSWDGWKIIDEEEIDD